MKLDLSKFILIVAVVACFVLGPTGWAGEENQSGVNLPADLLSAYTDGKRLVPASLL